MGFRFPGGTRINLLSERPRKAFEPTRFATKWASQALSAGVKQLGLEAGNSSLSGTKVMSEWSYISTHFIRFHNVDGGKFTFFLHLP